MRKRALVFFAVAVLAGSIGVLASANDSVTYNLSITDQGVGLIKWFTRVSLFAYDPTSSAKDASSATICRLPTDPIAASTVVFEQPVGTIVAKVPAGHYWILVWVDFLSSPVPYVSFEVLDGQTAAIDLAQIPFPKELVTY